MTGEWTKQYERTRQEIIDKLAVELKEMLRGRTIEKPDEIAIQLSHKVCSRYDDLYYKVSSDGSRDNSWFKNKVVNQYSHDKGRYEPGYEVDGFLKFNLPKVRDNFRYLYERANESEKKQRYFDLDFAESDNPEEIVKLLARDHAYMHFLNKKDKIKDKQVEIINKEKKLVKENCFNNLPPDEMLDFFLILSTTKAKNGEPFLSEKGVYDLVNLICRNVATSRHVKMNIDRGEKRYIIRLFYEFYKYCKDTVDSKATREMYKEILEQHITVKDSSEALTINVKNFAIAQPNSPIVLDEKYKQWENA